MDTDWIKLKTTTDEEKNIKSMDIGVGKLMWPAYVLHHYRDVDSIYTRITYTAMIELEIPPTAILTDALDKMIRNETMLLKAGFAVLHPEDQFSRKIGREIAKKNMAYHHFNVQHIDNRKISCYRKSDCVVLSLDLSDINKSLPHRLLLESHIHLNFYSSGKVILC